MLRPYTTFKRLILEKTEGTPFFMEEIVQEPFERDVLVRDGVGDGFGLALRLARCPYHRSAYSADCARRARRPHRSTRPRRENLAATARGHWA